MYSRNSAIGAVPADTAKYDGDQKCPRIEARFTRPVNSARSIRADTPFREFTSAETATFGGYSTSRCTWSSSPVNATRRAPKSSHTPRMVRSQAFSIASSNTPRRYFVTKTK